MLRNIGELLTAKTFFNLGRFNNNSVALLKTFIMTKTFEFFAADTRPFAINATLEVLNAKKQDGWTILGIEVTNADVAALCEVNIDPQHTNGDATMSAIKAIYDNGKELLAPYFEAENVLFVTVRTDADSVGAMVVAKSTIEQQRLVDFAKAEYARSAGANTLPTELPNAPKVEFVNIIHEYDTFAQGNEAWKAAPSIEAAIANVQSPFAGLNLALTSFTVTIEDKVAMMATYLATGKEPEAFVAKAEANAAQLLTDAGTIEVEEGIAFVTSAFPGRAMIDVAYGFAPVVVLFNPSMRGKEGTYTKYSICQFNGSFVDFSQVEATLKKVEAGVGGSPTFLGSTQGADTVLTKQVIKNSLIAAKC